MTFLNITVPESVRTWIDEQVAQGGYKTVDEYMLELLRDAQQHQTQERLEGLLLEGLDSGEPIEITDQYWAGLRERVANRIALHSLPS